MTDTTDDTKPKRRTRKTTDEQVDAVKPVRRTRKKTTTEAHEDSSVQAVDDVTPADVKMQSRRKKSKAKISPKEAFLEFVELDTGVMVLREVGSEEPLVSIGFADKVKEILGVESMQDVGQHMIQAAIASVMQRQMSQYHAHVYDEKPKRYS